MSRQISLKNSTPLAGFGAVLFAYSAARFGNSGGGVPSPFDAPANQIAEYFVEQATFTSVSAYLYGLSAVCLVVFATGMWGRLSQGPGDGGAWAIVGLAGSAVYAGLLLLISLLQLSLVGLANRDTAPAETVAALAITWAITVVILVSGSVPMLLGFGMAIRRTQVFSGLMANFALIGVVLGLLPPPEVVGPLSPAVANIFFVFSELQPWMLVFWMLGTSLVMRRSDKQASGDDDPATSEVPGTD